MTDLAYLLPNGREARYTTAMKSVHIFTLLLITLIVSSAHIPAASAAGKMALKVHDAYTLFAIPFTISSQKSTVIVPTTALRDTATSSSLGFTLKTPEGLRQDSGLAVGTVVKDSQSDAHILYVLFKDTTPSSRVNTMAITHLPFLMVKDSTGTTSQKLNPSELRQFTVSHSGVTALTDAE